MKPHAGPDRPAQPSVLSIRFDSLRLAIESMKPQTVQGTTDLILQRADSFYSWLRAEADNRPNSG
jgi:hypothetical protein